MDASKLFESIALLIDLAEQGEIDPWDVQVIDVIDRYLSKLFQAAETNQVAYEADLSQSGQAFLSASMLVLFKAKTLVELEQGETELDPSSDDFSAEAEDGAVTRLRLPLEQQLHRRPAAQPPKKRRVTLQELIDQLRLMATHLQQQERLALSTKTNRKSSTARSSLTQAARAIAALAHQENLTEVAGELEQFLNSHYQELDWLNLDQLVELWVQTKTSVSMASSDHHGNSAAAPETHDRVSVFWALLLLSAQSKVELSQEEFYQEIQIRALPNPATSATLPDCASA